MDPSYWHDLLRPVFEGKRVVLAGGVTAGWTATVVELRSLGAASILVVGTGGTGTGELPAPEQADCITVGGESANMLEGIRHDEALVANPPPEVLDALARFDPERESLVLGSLLNTNAHLDGRPFLAHRRPDWLALEDKVAIDAFWDRAGVAHAPSLVVAASRTELAGATHRLDMGAGAVWAGDASESFNGGAAYTRLIRSGSDAQLAADFLIEHCEAVRVMPFLPGIPCSIHGIVLDEAVLALRPVEMVVLHKTGTPEFFYAGCATYYDPPPEDREAMRDIARRVGEQLRSEVGFRGAFTVDGVMTATSFLPTELNPRRGAGLNVLAQSIDGLPLAILLDAISGGLDLEYRPDELEMLLVQNCDANRAGGSWARVDLPIGVTPPRAVSQVDGSIGWAPAGATPIAHVTTGPSGRGGFARFAVNPDVVPAGASIGGLAAALWEFADRELGTGVGALTPAEQIR